MHLSSLFSLFAAAVAVTMAQSQNQTTTGPQIFPAGVESCDNGGSRVPTHEADISLFIIWERRGVPL
ncbi:hypothetical protein PG984_007694 [Apiospora sp. TS-2023a]